MAFVDELVTQYDNSTLDDNGLIPIFISHDHVFDLLSEHGLISIVND